MAASNTTFGIGLSLAMIFLLVSDSRAYSSSSLPSRSAQPVQACSSVPRRVWLQHMASSVFAAALLVPSTASAADILSSKGCVYGEGEGCEDLAEGNPLILELQAKSAKNKEANEMEARNAYYMKNYPDWFAAVGKTMVKKPDGSFMVVDEVELRALKQANQLTLEYPSRVMGGKAVADVTQKPFLVLKE